MRPILKYEPSNYIRISQAIHIWVHLNHYDGSSAIELLPKSKVKQLSFEEECTHCQIENFIPQLRKIIL